MTDVAALVRRFYDELWDDDAVWDVLHPEVRFRGSLGEQAHGVAEWRAYRDGVRRAAPDLHNEVIDLVAVGDRAAESLVWSGTHAGSLLGIGATGRTFRYPGAAFFAARGGLLADVWVVGDLAALRDQLG